MQMTAPDWEKFGEGVRVLDHGATEREALCARGHDGQFDSEHCWACAWRKVKNYVLAAATLHETGAVPKAG